MAKGWREVDYLGDRPPPKPVFYDLTGVRFSSLSAQEQTINLSRLARRARHPQATPEDRQSWNLTWRCVKRSRPAFAEMMTTDPVLKEIMEVFDADICMPVD